MVVPAEWGAGESRRIAAEEKADSFNRKSEVYIMKRYSHIAIVTIPTGSLVKGEWMAGEPMEIELKGQYYPSRDSGGGVKKNIDGEERPVHGCSR